MRSGLPSSRLLAFAVIATLGVVYAVLARVAFDGFPFSGDEYSLLLQGDLFAHGMLHAPLHAHPEWFQVDHVVMGSWLCSKYPFGAPALLALGARLGAAWLVTPLEATATLVVVWHAIRRLLGPREALVGVIVLGLAPMFAIEASSFFMHTPTLLLLSLAFWGVTEWLESRHDGWLVLTGMALGAAFLVRPADALLFGVALLALRSPRAVIVPAACALPFLYFHLWYQNAQFGSPFTDGYHAYEPQFRALYGDAAAHPLSIRHFFDPVQQWKHLVVFRTYLFEWTVPGAVVLALVGAFTLGKDKRRRDVRQLCVALFGVFAVGLLLMISDQDDGPRPRYLSVTLIPLAVLAAAGFSPTCEAIAARFGARVRSVLVALGVVFSLVMIGSVLEERIPNVWAREGVFRLVDARHLHRAVVIVRAKYPSRYARNSPFDDDVMYLSPPVETPTGEIAAAFPDREIWIAREGQPWILERVR